MSARRLAAAVLAAGMLGENENTGPAWLRLQSTLSDTALGDRLSDLYPAVQDLKRPLPVQGPAGDLLTGRLVRVLRRAEQLAKKVAPQGVICARHLVAALLLAARNDDNNLQRFLRGCRIDALKTLNTLLSEIGSWGLPDDLEGWKSFVDDELSRSQEPPGVGDDEADEEDPDGHSADPGSVPRYTADSADGKDLVGIRPEVEAFAALVSAWSVEPPLSIGLFGEWGSGKTFFMRQMQQRVRRIAQRARESGVGQKEFGFYKNIVQVEFNAWHYAEGNLWASVVEHIFQNLRVFDKDPDSEVRARQERLTKEIESKTEEGATIRKEREALSQELRAAEQAATKAREDADRKLDERAEVETRAIRDAVAQQIPALKSQVKAALATLGVPEGLVNSPDQLRAEIDGAMDLTAQIHATLRAWWSSPGKFKTVLFALAIGAVPLAGAVVIALLVKQDIAQWLVSSSGLAAVLGACSWCAKSLSKLRGPLENVRGAVATLRDARARLDDAVAQADQQRRAKVAQLDADAAKLRAKAEENDKRAEAVKKDIDRLNDEIDSLLPAGMIRSFVAARASAEDYRRHLGLPAVIRRDFEKLTRMFQLQRDVEDEGKDGLRRDGSPLPGRNDTGVVNRIILYVDDLDRCPPEVVVEVLRVIHLLLAFPLFVVVVAVDARWMKRSLRDRFSLMLGPNAKNLGNESVEDAAEFDTRATPDDYLEKIFQIPYWIRSMEDEECRNLIRGLATPDSESGKPVSEEGGVDEEKPRELPLGGPGGGGPPPSRPEPGSVPPRRDFEPDATRWSAVIPKPPSLEISTSELRYMQAIAPVIGRSPRSVKRFVNCYRLIKTADAPLLRGQTPGYQVVMLMLAIVTGLPTVAPALMASLWITSKRTLGEWLAEVKERYPAQEAIELVVKQLGFLGSDHHVTLDTLRKVTTRVERYSFRPVRRRPGAGLPSIGGA